MLIHANAKINWSLDITGRREDGYHLMDMLMQPVSLYDEITLEEAEDITLTCSGDPYLPPSEDHLAFRAAKALQTAAKTDRGVSIHVCKHIPMGAGMGGGSADAAGVLIGLNKLWKLGLSQEELERIGLTLGADVPFCLRGGLQRTQGIGEIMTSPGTAPTVPLVVIQPCEGLSTGAIFKAYHTQEQISHPDTEAAAQQLVSLDLDALSATLGNVMQTVSEGQRPAIGEAILQLKENGAVFALMTGSGSAVFGAFRSNEAADIAFNKLSQLYSCCHRCISCAEPVVIL